MGTTLKPLSPHQPIFFLSSPSPAFATATYSRKTASPIADRDGSMEVGVEMEAVVCCDSFLPQVWNSPCCASSGKRSVHGCLYLQETSVSTLTPPELGH